MIRNKKQMFIVVGVFALVLFLGTVSYAFFNYTRTGAINNLGTGRISFNTTQSNTLNITNVFPMTSSEAANAYACGVKENESFCIEGTVDGSKYADNQALLQGANLWNNTCTVYDDLTNGYTQCGTFSGSLSIYTHSNGVVYAGVGSEDYCAVNPYGNFECFDSSYDGS